MNLSQRIDNPLDDENLIKMLIQIYSSVPANDEYAFYYRIQGYISRSVAKPISQFVSEKHDDMKDIFDSFVFNKMKNNMASSEDSLIAHLVDTEDFIKLKKVLSHVPDISSVRELRNLEYHSLDDDLWSLLRLLLGEERPGMGGSNIWRQVDSYIINQDMTTVSIEHRLYVNANYENIYNILRLFIKKCDQYKIPYCFKYSDSAGADDNIVIYSSSLYLEKYVEILEEIKNELKLDNIKRPPILTGMIDGWIGYGSEGGESYSLKRAFLIHDVIKTCVDNWIATHPNINLFNGDEKIDIQEIIKQRKENKLATIIMQNDSSFITKVKKEIINQGKKQGIDPNNFAFDVNMEEKLKQVETAMNYFDSEVTIQALPRLHPERFVCFFQDGVLNILCKDEPEVVSKVLEQIKKRMPDVDEIRKKIPGFNLFADNILIYNIDDVENQQLMMCGNAIIINDESHVFWDSLSLIGPNIRMIGDGAVKSYQKENYHHQK